MSNEKEVASDVYVNLEQLMFQLSHARVALKRLSKSVLENFLEKHVTAVIRVIHADAVIEMQNYRSEDDGIKSIESYCRTCKKKVRIEKVRRDCKICKHRLSFHCVKCNSGELDYNLVFCHLQDRIIMYCPKCGFCSTESSELKKHTLSVHKKKLVYQCLRCNKTMNNFGSFRIHEKYCGKKANISCAVCARKYKFGVDLELHVRRTHLKVE